MSASRDVILGRIRAALDGATVASPAPRTYRREGMLDRAHRLDLLSDRISAYRAQTRRLGPAELRGAVEAAFADHAARRVGVPAGLPAGWRPRGVDVVVDDGALSVEELDRLDGVLTGCTLAIAETGTIVLAAGPADGSRALTLVPDLHVCVVPDHQVVELVPEAIGVLAELVSTHRRPLTFVSGPSATSDIELQRIEGVHGPRRLVVLILDHELP